MLEPVFANTACQISGATADDPQLVNLGEINAKVRQRNTLFQGIDIIADRTGSGIRLLVDFLLHIVAIIALFDGCSTCSYRLDRAFNRIACHIINGMAGPAEDNEVALLQIDDAVGEGGNGNPVRAQIHLTFANADHQRAALARAD